MQVYIGKLPGGASEKNQGMHVVLQMSEGLQGHNITCDNVFTSYWLGDELQKRKLTIYTSELNSHDAGKIPAFLNFPQRRCISEHKRRLKKHK